MFNVQNLKKNYLLIVFLIPLILFIFSCQQTDNENYITFFGGKIKNPKSPYVYLFEGKKIIDSARLDHSNRFSFNLDSINTGLYTFKHGSEYQYLYLEPTDSLLIYLNTWDFDESLIFSGKGSAKNNYLINLYLEQEKIEKKFKYKYDLNEKEFSKLIDSGIQKQLATYNDLLIEEGVKPTPFFDKLAKTGIYFPFYLFKELYPFNHKRHLHLKEFPLLSKDFYRYRKNLNLNDFDLVYYTPYTSYTRVYLYNMAYSEKAKNPKNSNVELNFMKIVNDKIKIESLRNEYLAGSLWKSLSNDWISKKDFKDIEDFYYTNCSNEEFNNEIKRAIYQKQKLNKGDTLPNMRAIDNKGKEIHIKNLTKNSSTVIYFWPTDSSKANLLNTKLHHLKIKYPDILFLGFERNKENDDWKKFIYAKKLALNSQFSLSKDCDSYSLFSGDMDRAIIVNKNGTVKNGFLFFNDKHFEKHLKNLN